MPADAGNPGDPTVLGVGNVLMGDEGVGVRLMEAVRDLRDWPAPIGFVDGGAGGLGLLNLVEEAPRLLVFDAAEMGLGPGEHRIVRPEQIADAEDAHRLSLHDMPLIETVRLCEQFFTAPDLVEIFAVQPAVVDYGRELSEPLRRAWDRLVAAGAEWVETHL